MYESGAKYKLRKFRAMNFFLNFESDSPTTKKENESARDSRARAVIFSGFAVR